MEGNIGAPTCFYREWSEDASTDEGATRLRALSFNLLADGLAAGGAAGIDGTELTPELFFADERVGGVALLEDSVADGFSFEFRCPPEAVEWRKRWPMLLALVLEQDPDIIGLQEVDLAPGDRGGPSDAHDAEIRRDFAKAGYNGTFARKKGRALDGVAIFWKRSRCRPASSAMTLDLGSVFVAAAQPLIIDNKWRFTAVATHLKAGLNQQAETMRVGQAKSLLWQLWGHENVIILADLNAHCRAWLNDEKVEVKPQAYPLLTDELWSCYKEVLGDEPDFTCWGGFAGRDVRGVFDYIMYRGDILSPVSVLKTPAGADVLRVPERLPNAEHPSDHVPMVADFLLHDLGNPAKRQRLMIPASLPGA